MGRPRVPSGEKQNVEFETRRRRHGRALLGLFLRAMRSRAEAIVDRPFRSNGAMRNSIVLEGPFLAWTYVSSVLLGGKSKNIPVAAVGPI